MKDTLELYYDLSETYSPAITDNPLLFPLLVVADC